MKAKRNISIDILKIFLCFFVVAIHFPINESFVALARIAVPLFFMISGFLLKSKILKLKLRGGDFALFVKIA